MTAEARKRVIVLSEEAAAFQNSRTPMPVVEDIYSIGDGKAWVVVRLEPQCEAKIAKECEDAKISAYIPMEKRIVHAVHTPGTYYAGVLLRRKKKTTRKVIMRPVLPGYCFVEAPTLNRRVHNEGAAAIMALESVRGILGSENGPIAISNEFIDMMKRKQNDGAFDETAKRPEWVKPGEKVRIIDGPFASFDGEIGTCSTKDVLSVLVDLFGRMTPVQLDLSQVEHVT